MRNILFVGSKELGLTALNTLLDIAPELICAAITLKDEFDSRSKISAFRKLTLKYDLPLIVGGDSSTLQTTISKYRPDFAIVVGWYRIIPAHLLNAVTHGFAGFHASLLPLYRGGAPLVWAMINGDTETGISFFFLDDGMDSGDIIAQETFPILMDDTIENLIQKAEHSMVDILYREIPRLLNGTACRKPQRHENATYCAQRTPKDGHIDWSSDAVSIYNFIRAQTRPYPGAFFFQDNGTKCTVWSASIFPFRYYGIPGQVVKAKEQVVVSCGSGALILDEIQPEGLNSLRACEYINFDERLT